MIFPGFIVALIQLYIVGKPEKLQAFSSNKTTLSYCVRVRLSEHPGFTSLKAVAFIELIELQIAFLIHLTTKRTVNVPDFIERVLPEHGQAFCMPLCVYS
jgi:hypothetical protein